MASENGGGFTLPLFGRPKANPAAQVHCPEGCSECVNAPGCPMKINIPAYMHAYDAICLNPSKKKQLVKAVVSTKRPIDCISCNRCHERCPKKIDIPAVLKKLV